MMKNRVETNPDNTSKPRRGFRPAAFIWAFFNPISAQELENSLKETRECRDAADKVIQKTDELMRRVDEELAKDTIKNGPSR